MAEEMPEHHDLRMCELKRVIPIAQTRTYDSSTVTLLSLETYTDGCILHTLLLHDENMLASHAITQMKMQLVVNDDCGNSYSVWQGAMIGQPGIIRFQHYIVPTLDPAAREVLLEVRELQRIRFEDDIVLGASPGPGPFAITL